MEKESSLKFRLTSILTDWLMMNLGYLTGGVVIMVLNLLMQLFTGHYFSQIINQILMVLMIYVPWLLLNIWFDLSKKGSLGKQIMQLEIIYKNNNISFLFLRNLLKWSGTFIIISGTVAFIQGDMPTWLLILMVVSFIWLLLNMLILVFNKGRYHLIDKLANSKVCRKD